MGFNMSNNSEKIRSVLDQMDSETVKDALALFLADSKKDTQSFISSNVPKFANFAQAVLYLKKTYSFNELSHFTTEADLVYVQAGDRKVLLTDKDTASIMQERQRNISQSAANVSANTESGSKDETMENAFEPDYSSSGRFSHLEL